MRVIIEDPGKPALVHASQLVHADNHSLNGVTMPLRDDPDGMMRERIDRTVKHPVGKLSIDPERMREAIKVVRDRRIEQLTFREEQHGSRPPRSELLDMLAESEEAREIREVMGRR